MLLVLDLLPPDDRKDHLAFVGLAGVLVSLVLTLRLWGSDVRAFRGMMVLDSFALFFNLVIGYATGLVLLLSIDYVDGRASRRGEFYILVLFAAVGMMLMASAGDLIIVFLGLEIMSISLYVLAGFFRIASGGRGVDEVLSARRVRVGLLPLRHRPHLRRDRLHQPGPDRERGDGRGRAAIPCC